MSNNTVSMTSYNPYSNQYDDVVNIPEKWSMMELHTT